MIASARSQFVSTVMTNTFLCREHYRLTLRVPEFPATEPGQFIQISCRPMDVDEDVDSEHAWSESEFPRIAGVDLCHPNAVLRRPFSLAGRRDSSAGVELEIIHRVVGIGTDWLSKLVVGDSVHILGPLGNRFALPPDHTPAILVGGGVGIPPMLYLAQKLAGRPAVAFCGALSRDLLPFTFSEPLGRTKEQVYGEIEDEISVELAEHFKTEAPEVQVQLDLVSGDVTVTRQGQSVPLSSLGRIGAKTVKEVMARLIREDQTNANSVRPQQIVVEFAVHGIPSVITTDDGSFGFRGFVTQALERYLDAHSTPKPLIYTCGPEPMMKRVAEIGAGRGIDCQIAVERAMACGMGTCQSCVIKLRRPAVHGRDWVYKLACTDGPIFAGADLLW
jgi:NAD(P)H-flavin reductase